MSNCCVSNQDEKVLPRKQACPVNHQDYFRVDLKTVLHHIKNSWEMNLKEQGYYFCHDPDCDVVYFSEDNSIIKKSELRTKIAIKEKNKNNLICHCFGVSLAQAESNPKIKYFVINQTKITNCSCETSNPSGRCCLKDFPKLD